MSFTVPKFRQTFLTVVPETGTLPDQDDVTRAINDGLASGQLPGGTWEEWKLGALVNTSVGPNGATFLTFMVSRQIG